ncbi:hypothetical protein [Lusitaniella coriacea]|nr:hypothetical protein [Lusitaniella coriacea]
MELTRHTIVSSRVSQNSTRSFQFAIVSSQFAIRRDRVVGLNPSRDRRV